MKILNKEYPESINNQAVTDAILEAVKGNDPFTFEDEKELNTLRRLMGDHTRPLLQEECNRIQELVGKKFNTGAPRPEVK